MQHQGFQALGHVDEVVAQALQIAGHAPGGQRHLVVFGALDQPGQRGALHLLVERVHLLEIEPHHVAGRRQVALGKGVGEALDHLAQQPDEGQQVLQRRAAGARRVGFEVAGHAEGVVAHPLQIGEAAKHHQVKGEFALAQARRESHQAGVLNFAFQGIGFGFQHPRPRREAPELGPLVGFAHGGEQFQNDAEHPQKAPRHLGLGRGLRQSR